VSLAHDMSVEIARDLSAFGGESRRPCEAWFLLEGRDGEGDESTGSDLTGRWRNGLPGGRRRDHRISEQHMRRWRERYEAVGSDGLFDRRRGTPSPKRVRWPRWSRYWTVSREVFDLNVRHFHEKLRRSTRLSSATPGEAALQGAGWYRGTETRGASQTTTRRTLRACFCTSMVAAIAGSG